MKQQIGIFGGTNQSEFSFFGLAQHGNNKESLFPGMFGCHEQEMRVSLQFKNWLEFFLQLRKPKKPFLLRNDFDFDLEKAPITTGAKR